MNYYFKGDLQTYSTKFQ